MGHYPPYVKSIFYSIVLFAVAHLALSFFYGIENGDTSSINMFHVLGFDLFWPDLGRGGLNAILGVVLIVSVWIVLGFVLSWRDRKADEQRKAAKHHKEK